MCISYLDPPPTFLHPTGLALLWLVKKDWCQTLVEQVRHQTISVRAVRTFTLSFLHTLLIARDFIKNHV